MSVEIWQNEDAARLHFAGLQMSLEGEFRMADACFEQSLDKLDETALVERGHVYRDWVRVFAGLGSVVDRQLALVDAISLHDEAYKLEAPNVGEGSISATELAATQHVAARVQLAESLEEADPVISHRKRVHMAEHWSASLDLFEKHGVNEDYLHQMLSHGTLGMVAFGVDADKSVTNRIADAAWAETSSMSIKRKVIVWAGTAAAFGSGGRLAKLVAEKQVAGPYIVRPATR